MSGRSPVRAPTAVSALQDATFFVRAGEIYGIAGVSGNGQTELAEALMGAREPAKGEIWVEDLGDISHAPDVACAHRRASPSIPADRYTYALAGSLSIADNFAVAEVGSGRYGPLGLLDRAAMQRDTAERSANTTSRACAASSRRPHYCPAATRRSWSSPANSAASVGRRRP